MTIELSKTLHYKKVVGTRIYEGRAWVARCDTCSALARKSGSEPGEASDAARKEGWKPVYMGLTSPMRWKCYECLTRRQEPATIFSPVVGKAVPTPQGILSSIPKEKRRKLVKQAAKGSENSGSIESVNNPAKDDDKFAVPGNS